MLEAGEGIGYPLQYSEASPVGQMAKKLPKEVLNNSFTDFVKLFKNI